MRALLVLAFVFVGSAYAQRAHACSCMKLTPSEGFTSSTYVFAGEVAKIEKNEATRFGGREVTLRVKKIWKGEPNETLAVHTAGSSAACGYPFKLGQTYLVYAVSDDADPIRVSLCSRTALLDRAKEDLNYLGKPTHTFDGKRTGCSVQPAGTSPLHLALLLTFLVGLARAARRSV